MQWTYEITTASEPRVLMRLVQVFDQQRLTISFLNLALLEGYVKITVTVDVETELAYRIQAKLYNQIDIQSVDLHV